MSLGCFDPPFDKFYLVQDAVNWWHEPDFECWQRTNVSERRFVGWHYPEMFAILPRERDVF